MRLGRLPHDQGAVRHAPSLVGHRFASVPPPAKVQREHVAFTPGLYRNDEFPNCTAVALVNSAAGIAALNGYELAIDPALVPSFYASCVGCEPTDAAIAATNGAVMLDVLERQARTSFNIGPQALAGLFGTLPHARSAIASSIARLGHAYLGVALRERDMEMPPVWRATADDGDPVGGHAIMAFDYTGLRDTDTVRIGTWGRWQPAQWSWLEARVEEAYALMWRQLGTPGGDNLGVDADQLAIALINMSA